MSKVIVKPADLEIEVLDGETLMSAAQRQDLYWPTVCWGQIECMVCAVKVIAGTESLVAASMDEKKAMRERLPKSMQLTSTRLACRLKVFGEGVVVEKQGVRVRKRI